MRSVVLYVSRDMLRTVLLSPGRKPSDSTSLLNSSVRTHNIAVDASQPSRLLQVRLENALADTMQTH